jgi:hypothetical protein
MNRRELKKTINKIVENFADEALVFENYHTGPKDEINTLIDDAAGLLDDVMYDINHHSELQGKEVKVHFLRIEREFEERFADLEKRLQAMKNS